MFQIKINDKTYALRFGYGCFKQLAKLLKVEGIQGVVEKFSAFEKGSNDVSFDQIDMLISLVQASVIASGDLEGIENFNSDDCGDYLLANPDKLSEIMNSFIASFPKSNESGKQKAGRIEKKQPNRN